MARPRTITDDRLLAAAAAAIGRRGPGFTLADVGREAGVAAATLVQRFGSKQEMLLALAEHGTEAGILAMRRAAAAAPPGRAAVLAALQAAAAGLDDPATAPNHLAQLGADLADPALRDAVRADQDATRAELARLLDGAPGLGGAPPAPEAAAVLLALWNGTLLGWSLAPDGPLAGRIDHAAGTLLDGWSTP
ncbi:MAG: TetR/AcrR family transcriptional regulator [Thermoleophilia bacterium]